MLTVQYVWSKKTSGNTYLHNLVITDWWTCQNIFKNFEGLGFYLTCKIRSEPATVSWIPESETNDFVIHSTESSLSITLAFPTPPCRWGRHHTGPCSWVQVDAGHAVGLLQSWRLRSLIEAAMLSENMVSKPPLCPEGDITLTLKGACSKYNPENWSG